MAEQRAVKATLQRWGCSRVPNLDYLLYTIGLNSTNAFLTFNKEILKTSYKKLSGDVGEAITETSCVDFRVITIQSLNLIDLAINFLTNRGVNHDATLLCTLYQDAILNLNIAVWNMVVTKANTDGVDLKKLPKKCNQKIQYSRTGIP